MNMGNWSWWSQNLGQKHWEYQRRVHWGKGGVSKKLSSIFFPSFSGFSWCWWSRGRICNFSMNMGNWSLCSQHLGRKHWGYQIQVSQGQGGLKIVTLSSISPLPFMVYCGGVRVGGKFAIYWWIWGIVVSGARIFGRSFVVIRSGKVGDRGSADCNFIVNFLFFPFLVFHDVGGVGGKFTIYQWIWEIGVRVAIILGGNIGGIR